MSSHGEEWWWWWRCHGGGGCGGGGVVWSCHGVGGLLFVVNMVKIWLMNNYVKKNFATMRQYN